MKRLSKALHLLGAAGFIGAFASQLTLADPPAVDAIGRHVLQPALLLLIAGGLLSMAARPSLVEQRWLWAKLLLTMLIAPLVWRYGAQAAMPQAATALHRFGGWIALLLCAAALALAVWRPRLGQTDSAP